MQVAVNPRQRFACPPGLLLQVGYFGLKWQEWREESKNSGNHSLMGRAPVVRFTAALLILCAVMAACAPVRRPTGTLSLTGAPDIESHVQFILDAQRAGGAIAMTPAGSWINPYFANLAARALLRVEGNLEPVRRYMEWYTAHLNPDGTMDDYRVQGRREAATGDADSTDSYAATYLVLVHEWVGAGGDPDWVAQRRPDLERVAGAILAVTDADGLTWAKPGYRHKLLMDNCEVYAGWSAWSELLSGLGDESGSAEAALRARQVRTGLERFRQPNGLFGWAITRWGLVVESRPGRFYPDAVAQLFPIVWGLTDDARGYRTLNRAHSDWPYLMAADFPWVLPAYAAVLAGDEGAANQALAAAGAWQGELRWPWHVAESAWVITAGSAGSRSTVAGR